MLINCVIQSEKSIVLQNNENSKLNEGENVLPELCKAYLWKIKRIWVCLSLNYEHRHKEITAEEKILTNTLR
jgi:hypothetical protein